MSIRRSVVGRMWLGTVILVVLTLLVLGVLLTYLLENFYYSQQEAELVRQGSKLAVSLAENDEQTIAQLDSLEDYLNTTIMVINRSGSVRACGGMTGMRPGMRMHSPEVEKVLAGQIVTARGFNPRFNMSVLSAAVPIKRDAEIVGAVMLYTPVESISATIEYMRRLVLLIGAAAVFLVTILGFLMTRKLSLPLRQMKENAHRLANGDFKGRVPVHGDDEVGALGLALNHMAEQLEKTVWELSQEKEKLANIVGSMSDGVITFSATGKMMFSNEQADLLVAKADGYADGNFETCCNDWINEVIKTGSAITKECAENDLVMAVRMAPLWEAETPSGVVALLQDVTKERELERLRREFLASVSHELRTPLTYLQGYAEAMQDGLVDSDEQREQVLTIFLEETLRLRRLVNDLLDLNQLENGQLPMQLGTVDLNVLAERVKNKMLPLAVAKKLNVETELFHEEVQVRGDSDRLQQVLVNLVDNAIQHTPEQGTVTIAVTKQDSGILSVKDTGSGIDPGELELIWERFYKVDKARTRNSAGTGLGLAIVKNIISAHGGKAAVSSRRGQGTEFTVTIPLADDYRDSKQKGLG